MLSLTCPIPNNINPLQSNGFMLSITKLPQVSYFCQEANVPDLQLPSVDIENPLSTTPIPGDKLVFGEFNATFLVDEEMSNYIAIHNWMVGLGFPKSHAQYRKFIRDNTSLAAPSELATGYSDGVLQVLNSSNNTVKSVRFIDMFPTSLQSLQLRSTDTDTSYLAGNVSFRYTYYEFE